MTTTFAVNSQNDIYIGTDGNLAIFFDLEATLQACEQAAKTQLAEMVLQTNLGLPNFQTLWIGNPSIQQWEAALISNLQTVDGVNQVSSVIITQTESTLNYTATIQTIFGTGSINGELSIP